MHKKVRDYSKVKYDDLPKVHEPGERKIINSRVIIDRTVFTKDENERIRLKIAKQKYKESLK